MRAGGRRPEEYAWGQVVRSGRARSQGNKFGFGSPGKEAGDLKPRSGEP